MTLWSDELIKQKGLGANMPFVWFASLYPNICIWQYIYPVSKHIIPHTQISCHSFKLCTWMHAFNCHSSSIAMTSDNTVSSSFSKAPSLYARQNVLISLSMWNKSCKIRLPSSISTKMAFLVVDHLNNFSKMAIFLVNSSTVSETQSFSPELSVSLSFQVFIMSFKIGGESAEHSPKTQHQQRQLCHNTCYRLHTFSL